MESLLAGYFSLMCATVLYFAPLAERLGRKLDGTDKSKGPAGIPSFSFIDSDLFVAPEQAEGNKNFCLCVRSCISFSSWA